MPSVTLRAGCKVNLYLRITGKRPDGLHTMESLFYPMPVPADTLQLTPHPEPGIRVSCRLPYLRGETNILVKAYRAYAAAARVAVPGVDIHLVKRIPVGAGLGGGSSDAAALLRWLEGEAGALGEKDLRAVAAQVGADVPFFLLGSPAWVTGIGEELTPVSIDFGQYVQVIVSPRVRVSTAWAYQCWDEAALTLAEAPAKEGAFATPPVFWNDFESVVVDRFPVIGQIKEALLGAGALACVMSGSGSNLFALFPSQAVSRAARQAVERWRVGWHEVGGAVA